MEYKIESERLIRQPYVAIRTTVRIDRIGEVMGPLYGELFGWLGEEGLAPAGMPWARYLAVGPDECEMELGAPLSVEAVGNVRVIGGVIPACDVVKVLHVGPYDQLGAAYGAMADWMRAHGAQAAGAMWEVYLTDPMQEPDPAKWQTLVYAPISRAEPHDSTAMTTSAGAETKP